MPVEQDAAADAAESRQGREAGRSRLTRARGWLALASVGVAAALTYGRLYYGVDLTDESFYVAVPYRFALGARPLIDETNIVPQTPGLLLYPFLKLWDSLVGLDGVMLYARHLHLLFFAGVALALFVVAATHPRRPPPECRARRRRDRVRPFRHPRA